MTVAVIIAGLLPVYEGPARVLVMSRITAPLLSLFIIPVAYKLMWRLREHRRLAA